MGYLSTVPGPLRKERVSSKVIAYAAYNSSSFVVPSPVAKFELRQYCSWQEDQSMKRRNKQFVESTKVTVECLSVSVYSVY